MIFKLYINLSNPIILLTFLYLIIYVTEKRKTGKNYISSPAAISHFDMCWMVIKQ